MYLCLIPMTILLLAVVSVDSLSPIDSPKYQREPCSALKPAMRKSCRLNITIRADTHSDHYEPIIQDPVYVGSDVGGIYDWNLVTTPQTQLDGGVRPMPQGKVLGGGSILNAMCWNRGGADDYDAWEALGNPGWGWDGMLPYFKKVNHLLLIFQGMTE